MQDRHAQETSSNRRRGRLPTLAPRESRSSSTRNRTSATSPSGRPLRLSHRSRAGCYTCRDRKVKCDEIHPRCGPCKRLHRGCDWQQRWNFSDATPSTQDKHTNVNTSGNAVWDPDAVSQYSANPLSQEQDDLPDFASLASDEDRERKARAHRPGTFGVVVTPESFFDLPEYAASAPHDSRRTSATSYGSTSPGQIARRMPRPATDRSNTSPDANTIVLDRFEDPTLMPAASYSPHIDNDWRASYTEELQRLSITTSAYGPGLGTAHQPLTIRSGDEQLVSHFRRFIVPRLAQPQQMSVAGMVSQGSTKEVLELEATRFRPLHNAICAVSALNLAYNGQSSLEEAMQHYHQALAASDTTTSSNELLSDGVFFRHYLLFVYDICIPMQNDDDTNMLTEHLNHLRRIALQRHENAGRETFAYTLWNICELDVYACLLGSGTCDFVRTMESQDLLPRPWQQIPSLSSAPELSTFLPHEAQIFPTILALNQGILLRTAKIAQTAHGCRQEAMERAGSASPGTWARWQASSADLQRDMHNFWQQYCPEYLMPYAFCPGANLPERVQALFQHSALLYHAAMIYTRTSMFPGQRTFPVAGQHDVHNDTERRASAIVAIVNEQVAQGFLERRDAIFPVLMAGFATFNFETKAHAIEIIRAFEGQGIGQNTYRTRLLLEAIRDEQLRLANIGPGRMETVDWLQLAKDRRLKVVNCGL